MLEDLSILSQSSESLFLSFKPALRPQPNLCDRREVWIQGSILSTSQRALLPERKLSPEQAHAQDLAKALIQSHNARHIAQQALEFVRDLCAIEVATEEDYLIIPVRALRSIEIPHGYGIKGGAAREELVVTLGLRERREPRDIDLVRRGHHRLPADDEIARKIMARDFELGARVELIRALDGYLNSRDLTINEVVLIDDILYSSLLGVLDTLGQTIRPSRYRGGTLHRKPSLHGQSLLKMIRLYAEGACNHENWSIIGIPEEVTFREFDLAVHLNKAFQSGIDVADRFLHTCELLSLLPATGSRVLNALQELEHLRHGERGLFPDVPLDMWHHIKGLSSQE